MSFPELDKPADIATIRKLHQSGLLSNEATKAACAILQPAGSWFSWSRLMLLLFGCTLILTGIVFFFAYNWAAMGHFFKFSLIELGLLSCIGIAYLKGLSKITGKLLLLSASVLVGVLLAVFGQTYQTGADAFELFTGWAMLIFGWVVISEFAALWFVWLVLLNTGAILYWQQVGEHNHEISYEYLCLALALLNGSALALRELGLRHGYDWLSGVWHRQLLLLALLVSLTIPTINLIVEFNGTNAITAISALSWIVIISGGYPIYRHKLHDMLAITIIVMNMCTVILTLIGKVLFEEANGPAVFLLFALVILGIISGAIFWLRSIAKTMAQERNETKA